MKTGWIGVVRAGFHQSVYSFPRSIRLNYGSKASAAKNNREGLCRWQRQNDKEREVMFVPLLMVWVKLGKKSTERETERKSECLGLTQIIRLCQKSRLASKYCFPKHSHLFCSTLEYPAGQNTNLCVRSNPTVLLHPDMVNKASIKHSEVPFSLLCERRFTCYWFASSAYPKIDSCSAVICMHELWSCHCIMRACSNMQKKMPRKQSNGSFIHHFQNKPCVQFF